MRGRLQEIAAEHWAEAARKLEHWSETGEGEPPKSIGEGMADFIGLLIEHGYLLPGPAYEQEAKKIKKWVA